MTPGRRALGGLAATVALLAGGAFLVALVLVAPPDGPAPVLAQGAGVGSASWTARTSETSVVPSRFLIAGDSFTVRTDATWDSRQSERLAAYTRTGLRYTHEVHEDAGRLSGTGFWATNLPDPAFDRDDDDGDGRWEENEITAGAFPPAPGQRYSMLTQLTRWYGKRTGGECEWAWDRRRGDGEVLSQLSRELLGEWQAEHFTLGYDTFDYPRVGLRPALPDDTPSARCGDSRPADGQSGVVVTFAQPIDWVELLALPEAGEGRWTAFEAVGRSDQDDLTWTCGGPIMAAIGLRPCRDMGVTPRGVTAAVGYFDGEALAELHASPRAARVGELQDAVTGLLFDVGGFGVTLPGLTVNDAWWEVSSTSR